MRRRQTAGGILKHHRDLATADPPHDVPVRLQAQQADRPSGPVQGDPASHDLPRGWHELQDRVAGDRLPAPALADQSNGATGPERQADPLDRPQEATVGRKGDPKVLDLHDREVTV